VEQRLKELGLTLPNPPKPAGNYQPWILSGNFHASTTSPELRHRTCGRGGIEIKLNKTNKKSKPYV
jgi:hypothetical protein